MDRWWAEEWLPLVSLGPSVTEHRHRPTRLEVRQPRERGTFHVRAAPRLRQAQGGRGCSRSCTPGGWPHPLSWTLELAGEGPRATGWESSLQSPEASRGPGPASCAAGLPAHSVPVSTTSHSWSSFPGPAHAGQSCTGGWQGARNNPGGRGRGSHSRKRKRALWGQAQGTGPACCSPTLPTGSFAGQQ